MQCWKLDGRLSGDLCRALLLTNGRKLFVPFSCPAHRGDQPLGLRRARSYSACARSAASRLASSRASRSVTSRRSCSKIRSRARQLRAPPLGASHHAVGGPLTHQDSP
jgi:hypothetical protein